MHACASQMTKQLENEKAKLIEKKRQEQEERQRKQLELERILEDNRRLVSRLPIQVLCMQSVVSSHALGDIASLQMRFCHEC